MLPGLIIPINYADSALAVLLALSALVFKRGKLAWAFFAAGMLLFAAKSALAAALLDSVSVQDLVFWQRRKEMAIALSIPVWLLFSVCYSRGNYRESLQRWKWIFAAFSLILLVAAFGFADQLALVHEDPVTFRRTVLLGPSGKLVHLLRLVGSILTLMNLERTFRSAV